MAEVMPKLNPVFVEWFIAIACNLHERR